MLTKANHEELASSRLAVEGLRLNHERGLSIRARACGGLVMLGEELIGRLVERDALDRYWILDVNENWWVREGTGPIVPHHPERP